MAWADFWEMLDGRVWFLMQKSGVSEPKEYTPDKVVETREYLKNRFGINKTPDSEASSE